MCLTPLIINNVKHLFLSIGFFPHCVHFCLLHRILSSTCLAYDIEHGTVSVIVSNENPFASIFSILLFFVFFIFILFPLHDPSPGRLPHRLLPVLLILSLVLRYVLSLQKPGLCYQDQKNQAHRERSAVAHR